MTTLKKTVGRPAGVTRTERPKRVPLSGGQKRMHIAEEDQDPAFHYAWINDQSDLIVRAKKAGYIHVMVEEMPVWGNLEVDAGTVTDSFISMAVDKEGRRAYMMKLPMEYYEEDQKAAADASLKREQGMKQQLNSGQEGTYGEVKFS